jgi:hypothetical protein
MQKYIHTSHSLIHPGRRGCRKVQPRKMKRGVHDWVGVVGDFVEFVKGRSKNYRQRNNMRMKKKSTKKNVYEKKKKPGLSGVF